MVLRAVEVSPKELPEFMEWRKMIPFLPECSEAYFRKKMKQGLVFFFIESNGQRIGIFGIDAKEPRSRKMLQRLRQKISPFSVRFKGVISHLALAPEFRRKPKLFLRVINLIEGKARELGLKKVKVLIDKDNPNWRKTLKRGFKGAHGYSFGLDSLKYELMMLDAAAGWRIRAFFGKKEPKPRHIYMLTKRLK
jgi:hypothetical protein